MKNKQAVIKKIRAVFDQADFPGEGFLQGSFEGEEPYEEVAPFHNLKDWRKIDAEFLDAHAGALSFFSEAGFRFYLPAYLIADLDGQLETADPLFHLTHGFFDFSVEVPVGERVFVRRSGKSSLINPRRYGAALTSDHARFRLSIFTREEAGAIVEYLNFKRDRDPHGIDGPRIDAALESFWLERSRSAPSAETLRRHLANEQEFIEAVRSNQEKLN